MADTIEVSAHLHRVFSFVKTARTWVTAREIATGADVSNRTARAHAARLASAGIFDVSEVFSGFRYRFAGQARDKALVRRIEQAGEVFNSTTNKRG